MISDLQRQHNLSPEDIAKMTGLPLSEMETALKLLEIPDFDMDEEPAFGSDLDTASPPPTPVNLLLMPHEAGSYEAAMHKAMSLVGPDVMALIGVDVGDYKMAMGQAMGVSGVKLRNVALATICEAFLGMTEEQKSAAAERIAEKANSRFLDDTFDPMT